MASIKRFMLLLVLALCWGPSFVFIKLGLCSFSALQLVTLRLAIASAVLLCLLKIKKIPFRPHLVHWKRFLLIGIFANSLPFFLIALGEQSICSSLAAIINGSVPIFTALFAHLAFHDEPMTIKKAMGILIGFIGIICLFAKQLSVGWYKLPLGGYFILIASVSYALGMIFAKKYSVKLPNLVFPTGQILFAFISILPFMLVYDGSFVKSINVQGFIGVLGLAIFGTTFAFILYHKIVTTHGASYLSLSTLLFPIIGIILGKVIFNDEIHMQALIGSALISFGLILNIKKPKLLATKQ